jgi:hypothetical protein
MSDLLHFTVPVRHDATYSRNQQGLVRKVGSNQLNFPGLVSAMRCSDRHLDHRRRRDLDC